MSIAVENSDYARFSFNEICFIYVLQFADGPLFVGDGIWSRLWAIKSVLRGFELIPGFRINFHKSKLTGIHISNNFLDVANNFLACRREDK